MRNHLYLQVLCQVVSHIRIMVHYHHLYQAQVHRGTQVNHLATKSQSFLLRLLQLILLNILSLCHHMYQVRVHEDLQVLCQSLYHHRIQAHYQHLYQAQFHIDIQVNHLATTPQGFHP